MLKRQDEVVEKNTRSFPESVLCFMLATARLNSLLTADFITSIKHQLNESTITREMSLDRLWLGLAAQDLVKLYQSPNEIERYLAHNFERSLLKEPRIIRLKDLPSFNDVEQDILNEISKWIHQG